MPTGSTPRRSPRGGARRRSRGPAAAGWATGTVVAVPVAPLAILDLAPIAAGQGPGEALANSLDLARHAEDWEYRRYWLAEHHNAPGIASAATAVVIAHIAAGTRSIRVGAGGIMLPNHAPLVIAEQFGTLAELHPGRIDLGLGRAPGTDRPTIAALRRDPFTAADTFPQDVLELQRFLDEPRDGDLVQAIPGRGTRVPLWILGSSLYGAQLAAALGLPYAFASHFAPEALLPALETYRTQFTPSAQLAEPYAMVGANAIVADDDATARRLFTSPQQSFTNILRGRRGPLPPPIDDIETYWTPPERERAGGMLSRSFVGSPTTVRRELESFTAETGADEIIVAAAIHDHAARLRSYELLAELAG
jgi:luciferase family oxidoreductase group 1